MAEKEGAGAPGPVLGPESHPKNNGGEADNKDLSGVSFQNPITSDELASEHTPESLYIHQNISSETKSLSQDPGAVKEVPASPDPFSDSTIKSEAAEPFQPFDSGLACLVILLKFLGKAADAEQLRHQMGLETGVFSATDILRCAKNVEVKAKQVQADWDRLGKIPLPAIGCAKDGGFFLIGKIGDDKVLVQLPEEAQPKIILKADFEALWAGSAILMTTREQLTGNLRRFDVTWFIPAIVKYRRVLGEVLIASFFIQLMGLISPLFFQVVIDKVLVHKGLTTLEVMVFGLLVVSIFETLMGGLRTYVFSHTTNRVDVELGSKLFKHLLALPMSYFESRTVGASVARVRELEHIREFLTSNSVTLVLDLLFTLVFFAVMYFYSPLLTLIVVGTLPFYLLVSLFLTPLLRARLDEKFNRGSENQAFLVEAITGVQTLKAMAVEPQMQRKWEDQLAGYVASGFKAGMLSNIGSQLIQLFNKISMVLILFVGAKLVIEGDLTVGQLVAFNMMSGRVASPVLRLAQLWQDFQQVRISLERLGDILNTPVEGSYNPNRTTLPTIKGEVRFDGVTFRYRPDGPQILRRTDLVIPVGQILGIVGPSGSGKSTLTKLIQRLYVPENGRVMVDGVDLALVDPAWLRRQIGVVLQENLLFHKTVRENIALADPARDMKAVIHAANLAGAHDFVLQLPEGYDTLIDERGANLSGGQRQRLAIARALITNPRILILDEATSALDAESEEIIQNNLRAMAEGRTVIIIAHRLSALRQAHRIITIESGEIIEDGTHAELLARKGRYADLWRRQMGAREAAE